MFGTHPQQEVFPTLSFLLSPHSYMSSYVSSIFLIFFHWIPKIIFYGIINLSHFLFAMIWSVIYMDGSLPSAAKKFDLILSQGKTFSHNYKRWMEIEGHTFTQNQCSRSWRSHLKIGLGCSWNTPPAAVAKPNLLPSRSASKHQEWYIHNGSCWSQSKRWCELRKSSKNFN